MTTPVLVHQLAERVYAQPLEQGDGSLGVPRGGGVYLGDVVKLRVESRFKARAYATVWMPYYEGRAQEPQKTQHAAVALLLELHGMRKVEATETMTPLFEVDQ